MLYMFLWAFESSKRAHNRIKALRITVQELPGFELRMGEELSGFELVTAKIVGTLWF